jgi:predicted dehydrogenase
VGAIGVGVIGAGKHGERYLRHAHRDVDALTVAALARRDHAAGRTQAAAIGCAYHEAWEALVDDPAVALVIAVVPPTLHLAIARRVAAAGKALLVEKPLAPSGAAAREIVDLVHRSGIRAVMAHTLRWNGVVRTVRAALGDLGPLRALGMTQRFEPSRLAWLDQPEESGGGMLLHTGVHCFDLVRFLTGAEVLRVTCWTRATVTRRTEDNFAALLELDRSEALVTVTGSRDSRARAGLIDAAGTRGQVIADHQQSWGHVVRGTERSDLVLPEPVPTVRAVLESAAAHLQTGDPLPASLEDGARAVLIAEACARSGLTGRRIDVEPL